MIAGKKCDECKEGTYVEGLYVFPAPQYPEVIVEEKWAVCDKCGNAGLWGQDGIHSEKMMAIMLLHLHGLDEDVIRLIRSHLDVPKKEYQRWLELQKTPQDKFNRLPEHGPHNCKWCREKID